MENYPSNSRTGREEVKQPVAPKPEARKIEKVIEGTVVKRKKPLGKRIAETFVGGDDARSVWGYITFDVLVPAAKDMISDAISQGIDRMLFGDNRSRGRSAGRSAYSGRSGTPYTSYNTRYSSPMTRREEEPRREMTRRARATHDFGEIVLESRVEADTVLDTMFQMISQYDTVTVADLYETIGLKTEHTDAKWGWTDLRGSAVTRVRGGYLLSLPEPEPID